jgi:hypothetical protein
MSAAVAHEMLPHDSHAIGHGGENSCALCALLAMTAVVAVVAVCLSQFAVPAIPLPQSSTCHPASFRRIGHPRSPPLHQA